MKKAYKAYNKDILRSIRNGKRRFFSIALITALGVTMLTGLRAACVDLRSAADAFFDEHRLFDLCIVSTLGLTEEDVEALGALEEVAYAQGGYSSTVRTGVGEKNATAEVRMLDGAEMNVPYVESGVLPERADEIAVTEKYILDTGKRIGDTVEIAENRSGEEEEEEDSRNFRNTEYTITGIVVDVADINNPNGSVSFRSAASADYTFFVPREAVDSGIYTAVYLRLEGSGELFCYSEGYERLVGEAAARIEEQVKQQREQARYDQITGEAEAEIAEEEAKAGDRFAEAEAEIAEAEEEIADAERKLADGERELAEHERTAERELQRARAELADGERELAEAEKQLAEAEKQFSDGEALLVQGKGELAAGQQQAEAALAAAHGQVSGGRMQAESTRDQLLLQLSQIAGIFDEQWQQGAWEEYRQAAADAYVPVVRAQKKVTQTQQQMEAMEPGSAEYEAAGRRLAQQQEAVAEAEKSTAAAVAEAQQRFLAAMEPVFAAAIQGLDYQIMMLDPQARDYAEQMAALTAQKEQIAALPAQLSELTAGIGRLDAAVLVSDEQLAELLRQQAQTQEQFDAAWRNLAEKEGELSRGKEQYRQGLADLEEGRRKLEEGRAELTEQEKKIRLELTRGREELAEGRKELAEGERELQENREKYEKNKREAEEAFAEARQKISETDMTQWYVRDRSSLSGYANLKSDASSIEALGTVFPAVFFIVAILISLTTVTRMVEEDRGLIGTYKALGFTDREIRRKYLIYACSACLIGGVLGDLGGFLLLPEILTVVFDMMYLLPEYQLLFEPVYGIGGMSLFVTGIVAATAAACFAELKQMPAVLMRPKAPRSGSRVLIEYVTPLWRRLSFLNKVTARNLFRYKKRLFMTIAGIAGCTALLLFGFGVKDSVTDLMPRQYEQTCRYDLMAAALAKDHGTLLSYFEEGEEVLSVQLESVKLKNRDGAEEKVQMIVVPDNKTLEGYIHLELITGETAKMRDDGILVTQNAANVLGFESSANVRLQDTALVQEEVRVNGLVRNYLGNYVYMTQKYYESLFGESAPNAVLVNLPEGTDAAVYADELREQDAVLSLVCTQELREDFSTAFALINMVVCIVIIMAAGLAFVVLFTLASTNISERCRELATIKVLGFYDREVHLYVNKETLILTLMGIGAGIPLGRAFAGTLTYILNMPSIYLEVSLHPVSYVAAASLSFGFAMAVNLITDRSLDGIDPVEALKSVE